MFPTSGNNEGMILSTRIRLDCEGMKHVTLWCYRLIFYLPASTALGYVSRKYFRGRESYYIFNERLWKQTFSVEYSELKQ